MALHSQSRTSVSFPQAEGASVRYSTSIELSNAQVSGICVLRRLEGRVDGSLFNEFGLTILNFSYDLQRHKVKLHYVFELLDKWYIKRVLRKDLSKVLDGLQADVFEYRNTKRSIVYRFTPLMDEP